jgi:exonuclease VII small subunit
LTDQIIKGAEKYTDPLPGNWTAKQLIRHGKEENVDQFVYYEALEMVVERMENRLAELEHIETYYEQEKEARKAAENRANLAEKQLKDISVMADRERRKWANRGGARL